MAEFVLPGSEDRTTVIGRTGSGKTLFALWLLSKTRIEDRPWIIFDSKRDKNIRRLERAKAIRGELDPTSRIPKGKGLWVVRPLPNEKDEVEDMLWRIWHRRNVGIYIDEAYQMPNPTRGGAMQAILTQGRSLKIPVLALMQRPFEVERHFLSEANYYSVFFLNDRDDQRRVANFTPIEAGQPLARYHCRWHDVIQNETWTLTPVPNFDQIVHDLCSRAPRNFWD